MFLRLDVILVSFVVFEALATSHAVVPRLVSSLLHLHLLLMSSPSLVEGSRRDDRKAGDFPLEVVAMPVTLEVISVELRVMELDLAGQTGED